MSKLKPFPTFASDEEAEKFVEEADLSEYDFSGFRTVHFKFAKIPERVTLRHHQDLPLAVNERSSRGVQRPQNNIVQKAAEFMTHPEKATHEDIKGMAARILDDQRNDAKKSQTKSKAK